ncbi:DUF1501 domain-containing protein [Candidatus Entotheonella palauensis]|uniref:DUF1501 domain-containing protein n=1 Tax=Candidatus Entotheonella palauensis TaxID=93172 RepID=UPI000B7EC5C7|nr:DUF1501 domain-containing protein [Candidatus Entotheonella palauensis]
MLTRRRALHIIGGLSVTSALLPMRKALIRSAHATGLRPEAPRLVVTILRGGLDGLSAVPPYADPDYAVLRRQLATQTNEAEPGVVKLDDHFGLHPEMAPLKAWYDAGDLLIVHAIGLPARRGSHFAAQHLLESGTTSAKVRDGWLNRALDGLPNGASLGLAVGRAVPLILQGQTAIRAFVPPRLPKVEEDFLQRLDALYAIDPLFHQTFEQARPFVNEERGLRWRWDKTARQPTWRVFAEETGKLLAQPDGPRVAVLESHGWDTHEQQPARLQKLLAQLVDGLEGFKETLEPVWQQTAILVVTEFGRAAWENRFAGTDHGAGGAAFALGGGNRRGARGRTMAGTHPQRALRRP